MLDVGWGDLIYYLGNDSRTKSIVIYMETIGDARSFLSAAREVALTKPIIVIKPGRTEAAAKAAASHTGSLTGSDEVLQAAFRRVGVLRVDRIADLFNMAEVLSKQPLPAGKRLTIVTNAGGPGVLATDEVIGGGGQLAELTPETKAALDQVLPPHWSGSNPIDILGDAGPERYAQAVEAAVQAEGSDAALVILTPQAMTDSAKTAQGLQAFFEKFQGKRNSPPLLASWMGGEEVLAGEEILNQAGIPTFSYPDTAARMFNYMWRYAANLRSLYETPTFPEGPDYAHEIEPTTQIIQAARDRGRTILTEFESKQILSQYRIPTVDTRLAPDAEAAVEVAEAIGYPVVLKLNSETITHKTDVKGVQLNLASAEEVRAAFQTIATAVAEHASPADFQGVTVQPMLDLSSGYELIIGSSPDPQFGPVLLFGTGGTLVEVFRDRALGLPALNTVLARRMMERTRIYEALKGVRGRESVDLEELEKLLVRFSFLVVEQPWIKEIDINPLLAAPGRLTALDARVVLYGPEIEARALPELAIRPYPHQYRKTFELKNGLEVIIRPIRPEDEPLIVHFHEGLSDESVYMRYFSALQFSQRVAHERLTRICFIDYGREMALVAVRPGPDPEIIGVGRLSRLYGSDEAEFSVLIQDAHQGQGLGTELLAHMLEIARQEGDIGRVVGYILQDNLGMRRVVKNLGFKLDKEDDLVRAEIGIG
jgi:acetyltransferase